VIWGPSTDVTTMGANNCADVATESGDVGLLGASTSDFNVRMVVNQGGGWTSSTAGGAIGAVCNMSSTNVPANGLTWTWTPPVPTPMTFVSGTPTFVNNGQADPRSSLLNASLQVQVGTA